MNRRLFIRADADPQIGFGHVMRCVALAQAWRDAWGPVTFVSRPLPDKIANRLRFERFELSELPGQCDLSADARRFVELANGAGVAATAVDGYSFNEAWQESVSTGAGPLLVIDDEAQLETYHAALLVNPNLFGNAELYQGRCSGQLLCGPEFALIRKEFVSVARERAGATPEGSPLQLLVTLGGGEFAVLERILQAIETFPSDQLHVTIVAPNRLPEKPRANVRVTPYSDQLHELMAACDVAICGGGATNLELCLLGVPRIVVVLADNQRPVASAVSATGCGLDLGWHESVTTQQVTLALRRLLESPALRNRFAAAGRRLVDGQGAARVARALASRC